MESIRLFFFSWLEPLEKYQVAGSGTTNRHQWHHLARLARRQCVRSSEFGQFFEPKKHTSLAFGVSFCDYYTGKTNMAIKHQHFLIGDTSSNGWLSSVMLVFRGVPLPKTKVLRRPWKKWWERETILVSRSFASFLGWVSAYFQG